MTDVVTFSYKIDPLWDTVKQIRDKVEASLENYEKEIADASKMAASELIENAVKHGSSLKGKGGIQFEFAANDTHIKIIVINKIHSQEDYDILKSHIDQIHTTGNPEKLYVNRLKILMENTRLVKTQLGLFRIAYEGEFDLEYKFDNEVVTVTAMREI